MISATRWKVPIEFVDDVMELEQVFRKRMDYGHHVALYLAALLDPRNRHEAYNLTIDEVWAAEELASKLASADGDGKDAGGNAARLALLDTWPEPDAFKFIWSDQRSRLLLGRMWIMSYVLFNTRVMTHKEHHALAEAQEEWESFVAAQVLNAPQL
ncbi:hypothetical protein HaLaN_27040 [Haematococcus lacustris]|uniref:Uncharacterized protein n=1 Tax=Haematococcus lacustris TaxID=44745 RepID=A0A6A0A7V2_HAELA|nr:hypothetical protein HaLaN_27040 [Haematococcus lacustris]